MNDKITLGIFASSDWADENVIAESISKVKQNLLEHNDETHEYSIGSIITDGSQKLSHELLDVCRNEGITFGCFCPDYYPDGLKYFKGGKMKASYQTVRKSDYIVFFWDGESSGTKFLIDHAQKEGKRFEVVKIENPKSWFVFFHGKGDFLSNFYPATFFDPSKNVEFKTSEQAFMWYKALLFKDEQRQEIILGLGDDPYACKIKGRSVKNYDEVVWNEHREKVMRYVNKLKFSQNEELKQELLDTGDKILAEASPKDSLWGIGLSASHEDAVCPDKWPGENKLGQILMSLREEFKCAE